MAIRKITDEEIRNAQIQGNLPNRPTQKSLYPDNTYTAEEVKAAFDRLPKLIASRYNELVSAFSSITNGVISVLPDFSEADNGKVLYIENGESKWIKINSITNGVTIVGAELEEVSDEPVKLISFTVNGTPYQAESGMKWGEWVYSSYNTLGCFIENTIVFYGDNDPLGLSNTTLTNSDVIQENAAYKSTSYISSIPITFTINGSSFQATRGMMWIAWVESEYNTIGCTISGSAVMYDDNDPITLNNINIYNSDIIKADTAYKSTSYTGSTLISFTIDGVSYQAISNMKWGAWVASEYNTDGYVMNDTYEVIQPKNNTSMAVYNGSAEVKNSDIIVSGNAYTVESY